jgi:hypothetical protein
MFMIYVYVYLGIAVVAGPVMAVLENKKSNNWRLAIPSSPYLTADGERPPLTFTEKWLDNYLITVLAAFSAGILWPAVIVMEIIRRRDAARKAQLEKCPVDKAWLTERIAADEVEQLETVNDPLNAAPALPFGFLNTKWCEFRENLKEKDELWRFVVPDEKTKWYKGLKQGYVIIRKRKALAHFATRYRDR